MQTSHNFEGQLCFLCEGQIWGDGIFDSTPDGTGTTSYHIDCHAYKSYYTRNMSFEVKKLKAVVKDFLRDARHGYAHPDEWETLWCNFCGEHWKNDEEEVHNFGCPVERGRKLLKKV